MPLNCQFQIFLTFDFLISKQPPWEAVAIKKVDDLLESFLGIRDPELGRQCNMINCLFFSTVNF